MDKVKIMIADRQTLMREGLKKLFMEDKRFHVIADAGDQITCLQLLALENPDILILDIDMPMKNGLELLRELNKDINRKIKLLILTANREAESFIKSYQAGIDGYLFKDSDFQELIQAIFVLLNSETCFPLSFFPFIEQKLSYISDETEKISSLTKREFDVLINLAVGMSNKEIAMKLNISERTIKNHVSNIFKKISVSDRTQAAIFAIRNHLVDI